MHRIGFAKEARGESAYLLPSFPQGVLTPRKKNFTDKLSEHFNFG